MSRLLFSRIELWLVLILALLGVLAAVAYGWVVADTARGETRFGSIGQAALTVADIPDTIRKMADLSGRMKTFNPDRFPGQPAGWTFAPGPAGVLPGYVLLSRFDGDLGRHVVQFVSLKDGKTVHQWVPDATALLKDVRRTSVIADYTGWNTASWRAIHPLLMDNGDLIVKDHESALFRLDPCSQPVWKQDAFLFHHSTEPDGEGGFWIPSLIEPHTIDKLAPDVFEDALTRISGDGKIIYQKSLIQMFLDHGYEYLLFGAANFQKDPVHLNDIQPALSDGPYWKKGDLFLSFRVLSAIMIYRPSTDEIVWMKQGPWMSPHDVDILDDHRISVFDNQAYDKGLGARVKGVNRIAVYDFATGQVTYPYARALEADDVKTLFEGLDTILPDGTAMVEEENSGRLLFITSGGETRATFLNKAKNGSEYRMGWTRYVDQAEGDRMAAVLAAATCKTPG